MKYTDPNKVIDTLPRSNGSHLNAGSGFLLLGVLLNRIMKRFK